MDVVLFTHSNSFHGIWCKIKDFHLVLQRDEHTTEEKGFFARRPVATRVTKTVVKQQKIMNRRFDVVLYVELL